jgi:hypothetical protein
MYTLGRVALSVVCMAAFACIASPVAAAGAGAMDHPIYHPSPTCGKRHRKHKKHPCRVTTKKSGTSNVKKDPPAAPAPASPRVGRPAPPPGPGIGSEESTWPRELPPPQEIRCVPATPPGLPSGDGWVRGALQEGGGPAPGIYDCGYQPVNVVVSKSSSGEVAASQHVGEQEEWIIPLPPGTYSLATYNAEGKPVGCFSSPATFTVSAGQVVEDSVGCDIP